MGWTAGIRYPTEERDFSLPYSAQSLGFQTGSGVHPVHPATSPMATGALSLRVKRQGREADHLPPSSAEVRNGGTIPPFRHVLVLNYIIKYKG
jgi:hypothetical protein